MVESFSSLSLLMLLICLQSHLVGGFAPGVGCLLGLKGKGCTEGLRLAPFGRDKLTRQCSSTQLASNLPLLRRTSVTMEVESISTPVSILDMMQDAGKSVAAGVDAGLKRMAIEIPLPVTGGTELDDWPGGIKQKYSVLKPMLAETLKLLNFTDSEIQQQEFLGISDDAIGVWKNSQGVAVVAFATPEVLPQLQSLSETNTLVLINHQFFLDEFSAEATQSFIDSCTIVYFLQSLSMKGPGLLPVKGYMLRQYPDPFKVARRTDEGGKQVLDTYAEKPARAVLDDLFYKDSEERDKDLGLFERLKRIQKEASNI
mmetsp:Transcript_34936/g.69831  ORF Transcript_34936/g.69831 Transcript_34936/m.69831 type:complete len:314 (+) Transcript_34936:31-972(+)